MVWIIVAVVVVALAAWAFWPGNSEFDERTEGVRRKRRAIRSFGDRPGPGR